MIIKPIPKAEIVELLTAAIERNKRFIDECLANDNPQVEEMVHHAQGKVMAFESVLYALTRHERYGLRVEAAGHIGVVGD